MKNEDPVMFAQSVTAAILCRSWKNPITGAALAQSFGVDIRKITEVVWEARRAGIKIASSKGGNDEFLGVVVEAGYYQAKRPEEMAASAAMLHKTAMDLLRTEKLLMDFHREHPSIWEQSPQDEEAA